MEQHWTCQLSTAQGCYLLICLRFLNWKIQTQVQNGGIEKFHYHRGNFQRLGNEQATSWPFTQDSHLGCKLGAGQPALAALDRLCSRNGFWQWSQVTLCTRAVQNISLASFYFMKRAAPALFLQYIQRRESPINSLNAIKNESYDFFHMPLIPYPLG